MCVILLPILLFGAFISINYVTGRRNELEKKYEGIYNEVTNTLEKEFAALEEIYKDTKSNDTVEYFMTTRFDKMEYSERVLMQSKVYDLFWDSMNKSASMTNMSIFGSANSYIYTNDEGGYTYEKSPEWYQKCAMGKYKWFYKDGEYIIMTRDISVYKDLRGIVMAKLSKLYIDDLLQLDQYDTRVSVRLSNETDEDVYMNGDFSGETTKGVLESMIPVRYEFTIDKSEKTAVLNNAIIFSLIYIILGTVVAYMIARWCAKYLCRSIGTVISGVGEQKENAVALVSENTISEVGMKGDVEAELTKSLNKLHSAQLTALQMQMNPHFLFNTLSSVNVLVLQDDVSNEDVADMVDLLADILEYAMSEPKYTAKVSNEIEMVKKYIEIERAEVRKDFEVEWEVEEKVLDRECIKLFLQPIVENAISHGIKGMENRKGRITISVKSDGDDTLFTVTDNGNGIEKEKLKKLQEQLMQPYDDYSKHIGVRNVNERVKLIYGKDYGVSIDSDKNGTKVTVKIGGWYNKVNT